MRILIDTNIWISALISLSMRKRLDKIIANPEFVLLGSTELLAELADVMARPKFAQYIEKHTAGNFLEIISGRIDSIEPQSNVQICRDPNDDYLLAICLDGKADVLISGDKDLLELRIFGSTRILTINDFESLFP